MQLAASIVAAEIDAGIALFLFVVSGLINVLALTGSLYMLQVYDRALSSGSVQTLAALSALAIGLYLFQGGFDVIRSQVLALRETEFIMAARSVGAATSRIVGRHLLPNVSNTIIVSLSLGLAGIAGSEIVLTWFGIGIQPPHPGAFASTQASSSARVQSWTRRTS